MRTVAVEDQNLLDSVHRQVVVAFLNEKYLALADHLKIAINLSYQRLRAGRLVQKVTYAGQTILLLTMLPASPQVGTVNDEAVLNEAFEAAGGVGKVTADHYELKLARGLIDKFGKAE